MRDIQNYDQKLYAERMINEIIFQARLGTLQSSTSLDNLKSFEEMLLNFYTCCCTFIHILYFIFCTTDIDKIIFSKYKIMRNTNNKRHKSDVPVLPRNFTFRRHEIVFKLFPNLTGILRGFRNSCPAGEGQRNCLLKTNRFSKFLEQEIHLRLRCQRNQAVHTLLTILKARNYARHMLQARLFQLFLDLIRWACKMRKTWLKSPNPFSTTRRARDRR